VTFVIGVDGGGTRTRAVLLAADGRELARAEGPGAVVTSDTSEVAARAVSTAVHAAAREAGVTLPAAALWAGLAGAGREPASGRVEAALASAGLADRVHVATDAEAAFHDAFGQGSGVLLIAGTGSIALGRGGAGRWVRAGGWGQRVGDEGSGYAIGEAALRAVMRAHDGRGPSTTLSESVIESCAVASAEDIVGWIERASKGEVAALVPSVAHAAAAGDAAARAILGHAVSELAGHVAAILRRAERWPDPVPLALWGGLLGAGGPLRAATLEALAAHPVDVRDIDLDPPAGAAQMALALR
jgi:glucosamine kinase